MFEYFCYQIELYLINSGAILRVRQCELGGDISNIDKFLKETDKCAERRTKVKSKDGEIPLFFFLVLTTRYLGEGPNCGRHL